MANEKRLINVNPAYIQHILAKVPYYADEIWKFTAMTQRFPTVDAVEVAHGRWERLDKRYEEMFKCSVCRSECYVPTCMGEPMYDYCPNCGADMRDGDGNA